MALTSKQKKLTQALVQKATSESPKGSLYWDLEVKGFGIHVFPSGKKTFIFNYRARRSGRQRRMTLGYYPSVPVDVARTRAMQYAAAVADNRDPALEIDSKPKGLTFGQFAERYIEEHSKPTKKSWLHDQYRLNRTLLPAWEKLKLDSITPNDFGKIFRTIGADRKAEANNTFRLVSSMFNVAKRWKLLPKDYEIPVEGYKTFPDVERDRFVTPDELPRLLKIVDEYHNHAMKVYFKLLLLTGMRRTELLSARWKAVDFELGLLAMADSKANRQFTVPLSPQAMDLLRTLDSYQTSPYLFPNAKTQLPMTDVKRHWKAIRKATGFENGLRLHDLRRTTGSWLAMQNLNDVGIRKTLNHTSAKAARRYQQLVDKTRQTAMADLATNMGM